MPDHIPKILVCVTKQKACVNLLERGASLRNEINGELLVLHVTTKQANILHNEHLEYLMDISRQYNASMTVLFSDNVIESIKNFIKSEGVSWVILGETRENLEKKSTLFKLQKAFGNLIRYEIVSIIENEALEDVF